MDQPVESSLISKIVLDLLEETFEKSNGYYLDSQTSLFETIENISAAEASIPVGGNCATLAAQVSHITFYMKALEDVIKGSTYQQVDWGEIWRTINQVSPQEWQNIQSDLKQNVQYIQALVREKASWQREDELGSVIGIITHTAYHLGEIRQALCMIRS